MMFAQNHAVFPVPFAGQDKCLGCYNTYLVQVTRVGQAPGWSAKHRACV